MAITKIIAIRDRLDKRINYAVNGEKTTLDAGITYATNPEKTEQHFFLGIQFLQFFSQLCDTVGKVMQLGYLIKRRFFFLRKQIFTFLAFRLDLLHQARISL